ncbi:ubiquinol-cytochrome c reductase iron-sulfur subunit [Nostoc sp. PCC 7107]|uniref:QcrA and Rieske domain-containing protein n=1 Tax=Nostoc sp. PCC 7107 TaxID=317936 RepID=UPI00029F2D97|nr:ubiquinol-cytochrome c reductase iron-sulfur subunit [Nostoc sp. PCC 7107]AFY42865.1 Rieske (2Fe-2S) iron-sulfur domain protein [Nostoc sp. PCC 7107]
MKRRDFINWVGLGLIASSLPVAIAACNSEKSTSTSATSTDWQKVGTTKDLDQKGQLLVKSSPVGNVLVVGTSQAGNLIAVDPTCTHKGCTVDWKADAKKFACPCHRAEYGTDGQVQKGPAEKSLKTYTAKIEGDAILVKG